MGRPYTRADYLRRVEMIHDALEQPAISADVIVGFPGEDEAHAYRPPGWFGEELTGVRGWSNGDLARDGRPDA